MLIDRLRAFFVRLRNLFLPGRDEREVADEMAFHLEQAEREHLEGGASPEEARRLARLDFGGVEAHRLDAREGRFGHGVELWMRDLKLSLRRLGRAPFFSLLTVATLALGLGAAALIWSLARSLLTPALPYPDLDRVVVFKSTWVDQPRGSVSPAELLDYERRLTHVLGAVGASAEGELTVRGSDVAQRVRAAWVTQGLFQAFGTPPVLGRGFTEEEVREGADLAVLSHRLWRERFDADPEILGQTLSVAGGELEIVGVLGAGVDLPGAILLAEPTDLFVPMPIEGTITNRGNHFLTAYASLAPGVDLATARAETEALGREFWTLYPNSYSPDMRFAVTVERLGDALRGPAKAPVAILALVVGFLLLVAVTNVAALLLSRIEQRGQELALTTALGAGRAQLIRQVGLEHGLLVLAGGAGGLALAHGGLLALKRHLPSAIAHLVSPRPDTLWVVAVLTAGLLMALTLFPLAGLDRRNLADRLRMISRSATVSRRGTRLRRSLVAGQVAFSLVLLTVAGLLAGSFVRLTQVDPGYRTAELAATRINWPNFEGDSDPLRPVRLHRELLEKVRALPGVRSASSARFLVLEDRPGDMGFEFEGQPIPDGQKKPDADWQVVTPGYFETLGIRLEEGRALEPSDDEHGSGAIVVDREFARAFSPDRPVLGRRLRFGGEHTGPRWATIVGVVQNVRHQRLDEPLRPRVYIAHAQFRGWADGRPISALHLIVETSLPFSSAQEMLRTAVDEVSPQTPLDPLRSIESLRADSLLVPKLLALLPIAFGVAALSLAMIGLFGIVMQSVLARRTEMGIRQALGARRGDLVGAIFWDGFRLALMGGVLGLVVALGLAKALESRLYATSAFDPASLVSAWAVLAASVALACLIPALRAARIDPITLLRSE